MGVLIYSYGCFETQGKCIVQKKLDAQLKEG